VSIRGGSFCRIQGCAALSHRKGRPKPPPVEVGSCRLNTAKPIDLRQAAFGLASWARWLIFQLNGRSPEDREIHFGRPASRSSLGGVIYFLAYPDKFNAFLNWVIGRRRWPLPEPAGSCRGALTIDDPRICLSAWSRRSLGPCRLARHLPKETSLAGRRNRSTLNLDRHRAVTQLVFLLLPRDEGDLASPQSRF
jgi:hypothetical protein